jgi:hypothetical protein
MGYKIETQTHNGAVDGLSKEIVLNIATNENEQNIFIQSNLSSGTDSYTATVEYEMIGTDYFKSFVDNEISNTQTIGLDITVPAKRIRITSTLTSADSVVDYDVYVRGFTDG